MLLTNRVFAGRPLSVSICRMGENPGLLPRGFDYRTVRAKHATNCLETTLITDLPCLLACFALLPSWHEAGQICRRVLCNYSKFSSKGSRMYELTAHCRAAAFWLRFSCYTIPACRWLALALRQIIANMY